MSNTSLIIGESGTGKSSSIRKLDPKETFIINVLNKPLPFKGYKQNYKVLNEKGQGNYCASDDYLKIIKIIKYVNEKRPEIKNLIIDDWQYTMCNEFMRRASENGFAKFTEIGQHAWSIIKALTDCRDDLYCFVLSHSDSDANGKVKCKSIGKMLDEKITIEGMFTVVLHTQVIDGHYRFLTQFDGTHLAKSPDGMFDDQYLPNDLAFVKQKMLQYAEDDALMMDEEVIEQADIDEVVLASQTIKTMNVPYKMGNIQ